MNSVVTYVHICSICDCHFFYEINHCVIYSTTVSFTVFYTAQIVILGHFKLLQKRNVNKRTEKGKTPANQWT